MQRSDEQIVVDVRASQIALPATEIQSWAADHSIFVSSLITDLQAERGAVRRAIIEFGARPVMFEYDLGGQDVVAEQAYLDGVRTSDIYVGVFGSRYGVPLASGYAATDAEFRAAVADGLRMALFVNDTEGFDGRQRDFVGGLRNAYTTSPWLGADDLADRVSSRLIQIATEEIAPWVRLGDLIFRAREIRTNGAEVVVVADIRTPAIHAAIQDMANRRTSDLAFAAPGIAAPMSVASLTTQTQSTTVHRDTISLRMGSRRDNPTPMSFNTGSQTWSAGELAYSALSDALFGTSLSPQTWGIAKVADPLAPLRAASLPESIVRPVAQLLLTEALVNSGTARTVDSFRLGPPHNGARSLSITWTPPRVYGNTPAPASQTLTGEIRGL